MQFSIEDDFLKFEDTHIKLYAIPQLEITDQYIAFIPVEIHYRGTIEDRNLLYRHDERRVVSRLTDFFKGDPKASYLESFLAGVEEVIADLHKENKLDAINFYTKESITLMPARQTHQQRTQKEQPQEVTQTTTTTTQKRPA